MKVNTSVQYKDVLKNFPKGYSNAELCKHFASEYGKITKRVFPNRCFAVLATKFRNEYVKKYRGQIGIHSWLMPPLSWKSLSM